MNPDAQSASVFSLPADLQLGFDVGRQIDDPSRWMVLGPEARVLLSTQYAIGNLKLETYARYNYAYDLEGDEQELIENESLDYQLNELYLQKSINAVTLNVGLIKLAWGVGDLVSILDVISPRDNREFLSAKPKDQRMGQFIVGVDYWLESIENSSISFLLIPKARSNLTPPFGHPYSLTPMKPPRESSHEEPEGALRFKKEGDELAFGVYYASIHEREPFVRFNQANIAEPFTEFYPLKRLIGLDLTYSLSPVLLKTELVHERAKAYQAEELSTEGLLITKTRYYPSIGVMLGLDYHHDQYGSFSLEGRNWYFRKDSQIEIGIMQRTLGGIFWSKSYLREELKASVGATFLGSVHDVLAIVNLEYSPKDNWVYTCKYSYLDFKQTDEPFASMDSWDRVQFGVKYNLDMR